MQRLLVREPYACTPICKIVIALEALSAAIGPAGDSVYVPMRITGGSLSAPGSTMRIVAGSDFAVMHPDETLVHGGQFVVADPAGEVLVWYDGPSQAPEGAYDDVLDGRLPARIAARLTVHTISTRPEWRSLNRRPLLGAGFFDGATGTLEITVLAVTDAPAEN